jgi:hypothetical protein
MNAAVLVATMPWARLSATLRDAWSKLHSPPRPLTRGEEAEQVRALARSLQRHDRGFADDLFAAAARHEGLE